MVKCIPIKLFAKAWDKIRTLPPPYVTSTHPCPTFIIISILPISEAGNWDADDSRPYIKWSTKHRYFVPSELN